MASYRNATICINGHVLSTSDSNTQAKCSKCGNEAISSCGNCGTAIRGSLIYPSNYIGFYNFNFPNYCHNCGEPYPWTSLILDNVIELMALEDDVDDNVKEIIKNSIPGLLVDSPKTPLSVAKYQKNIGKFSDPIKNGLYQILIDVVSESVKKILFPQ